MGAPLTPYDLHVGRYSPALAAGLLRAARVAPAGRALDVGCGTGALTRALAALLGAERVSAVDPSPEAVDACARAVPGADVRLGAAEALGFPDAMFAAVLAQLVIDKVDGPAAVAEMRRVARPGGVVAGCVWAFEDGMPLLRAFWDAALAVDPEGAGAAGAGERPPYTRPDELRRLWSGAGLASVETGALDVAAGYANVDDAWWPLAASGAGASAQYCLAADEPTREAVRQEFTRRLGSPSGPFTLPARAWYVRGVAS